MVELNGLFQQKKNNKKLSQSAVKYVDIVL